MDRLRRFASLDAVFDPIVVSAEVGAGKAGTLIFERALQSVGIAPGESVFIDNSQDNLAAPRRLGMHAIHFDDEANDVAALAGALQALGLMARTGSRSPSR
jgi:putative hydrolase of the HAD superfamily